MTKRPTKTRAVSRCILISILVFLGSLSNLALGAAPFPKGSGDEMADLEYPLEKEHPSEKKSNPTHPHLEPQKAAHSEHNPVQPPTEPVKKPVFSGGSKGHLELKAKEEVKEEGEKKGTPICGVLESFVGDVQVLDPSRQKLQTLGLKTALPCGVWIATNAGGWAHIRHEEGPVILLGSDTLVQVLDFESKNSKESRTAEHGDHITLYKGELYAELEGGEHEFRIVSPTGRVRISRGRGVMVFSQDEDRTQLVSLDGSASLENRFENEQRITVHSGQITELNFKLMRVVPSLPKPVSVPSLHPMLVELRVPEREQALAEASADRAKLRQLAGVAIEGDHEKRSPESYLRHKSNTDDLMVRKMWIRKLAGGSDQGEKILYPDHDTRSEKTMNIEVQDVEARFKKRSEKAIEEEKRRIMQELTRIRTD
ncbi:MAG: FecR domain-containing protein [Bdellovibrio sp.]|nr:FecR domain-containing protein [Bdellovibrio sp.]